MGVSSQMKEMNAEKRRRLEAAIERDVRKGRRGSEESMHSAHHNEEEGLPRTLKEFTPICNMKAVREEIKPLTEMCQSFLDKVILYARMRKKVRRHENTR